MEVNNLGDALLPEQKPTSKKGGSIHLNMFEGLKDAVVGGGTFTCGEEYIISLCPVVSRSPGLRLSCHV